MKKIEATNYKTTKLQNAEMGDKDYVSQMILIVRRILTDLFNANVTVNTL